MARWTRRGGIAVFALVPTLCLAASPVVAGDDSSTPVAAAGVIGGGLSDATGPLDVVLRLSEPSLAEAVAPNATRSGTLPDESAQHAIIQAVEDQQRGVMAQAADLGAVEVGAVSRSLNAVVVHTDAATLSALAAIPGVKSVSREPSYDISWPRDTPVASGSLAQAVRYFDVDRAADDGLDGTGVRAAVIDSGIDFTHANLGGPGTPAAYAACYGTPPGAGVTEAGQPRNLPPAGDCATLFGANAPKVIGGYDFVGESWPNGPVAPDENPIDFQGHGTHVADILAGLSADGTHRGLAPGVKLYAYKACSAVSTGCNGTAVLQAIDRALDPNQDGNMSDAVDIINMSLGSFYGQPESADTLAVSNAVRAGVVVAVAAGNDGDRPWIVGQPSISPAAIAVAETALPDASLLPIQVLSPTIAGLPDNTVKYALPQTWAPAPAEAVSGVLTVPSGPVGPSGAPASQGCDASNFANFDPSVPRIALLDRGTCDVTLKVTAAGAAGASAAVLANDRPGVPPTLNAGQGTPAIPTVFVTQDKGDLLKQAVAASAVEVRLDPAQRISLTNSMEISSSRGPSQIGATIKPDLGAPGAWISAVVGTGAVERPFSGTSGAAPVVAAAAALLRQAHPGEDPAAIKRRLVSSADTNTRTVDIEGNISTTPVTRVGGGEVRPFAAISSSTQVGDPANGEGNLSIGVQAATGKKYVMKKLTITNSGAQSQQYAVEPSFRKQADADSKAITVMAPDSVVVPAGGTVTVPVVFAINAERLPAWPYFDSSQNLALAGASGNNSLVLNDAEVDGHLIVRDANGDQVATLGWQALPKRSSATVARTTAVQVGPDGTGSLLLRNLGVVDGGVDAFVLTGSSDRLPTPAAGTPGSPGSNEAVIDLANVGVRDAGDSIQFAITQQTKRPTPEVPALIQIEIDADGDGNYEHLVFNDDYTSFRPVDGRSMVWAGPRGAAVRYGPVDTDIDSTNMIYTVPLAALGLTPGQTFAFRMYAFDRYFTGHLEDSIVDMKYTVGSPHYGVVGGNSFSVPALAASAAATVASNSVAGPSTAAGLLLLYRVNGGSESSVVAVNGEAAAPSG
jgi:minor extracellular serine protease Vpr